MRETRIVLEVEPEVIILVIAGDKLWLENLSGQIQSLTTDRFIKLLSVDKHKMRIAFLFS